MTHSKDPHIHIRETRTNTCKCGQEFPKDPQAELQAQIIKAVTPYAFGDDGHLTALSDKDCYQWINAIAALFQAHQQEAYKKGYIDGSLAKDKV